MIKSYACLVCKRVTSVAYNANWECSNPGCNAGPIKQLPEEKGKHRKSKPVFSGLLMYFPDAMLAIAEHSKKGNDKHNPGEPLRWAKEKSSDQADCVARHLIDIGPNWDAVDQETGSLHATALAWRALALLQTVLERGKK